MATKKSGHLWLSDSQIIPLNPYPKFSGIILHSTYIIRNSMAV